MDVGIVIIDEDGIFYGPFPIGTYAEYLRECDACHKTIHRDEYKKFDGLCESCSNCPRCGASKDEVQTNCDCQTNSPH